MQAGGYYHIILQSMDGLIELIYFSVLMSEEEDLDDEIIGPMPLVGRDEPKEVCVTCYEWTQQLAELLAY